MAHFAKATLDVVRTGDILYQLAIFYGLPRLLVFKPTMNIVHHWVKKFARKELLWAPDLCENIPYVRWEDITEEVLRRNNQGEKPS